jgi:hypothetical protein
LLPDRYLFSVPVGLGEIFFDQTYNFDYAHNAHMIFFLKITKQVTSKFSTGMFQKVIPVDLKIYQGQSVVLSGSEISDHVNLGIT